MNKKEWDKFLTTNREIIDEFLGPNNEIYTAIVLKGQIASLLPKEEAFKIFEDLMNSGKSQLEQNNELRKILDDLKKNV